MRQEKQYLLDAITEKIEGSSAFVVTRYQNLNPNLSSNFRKTLRRTGGDFTVLKKRLLFKAAKQMGVSLNSSQFEGHIGIVFALKDPLATTKALFDFAKENEQTLTILAGLFDGKLCSAEDVKAISELPSEKEMRAQFLGLLEAPMSQTLSVIEAILTTVMHCIENKLDKDSK